MDYPSFTERKLYNPMVIQENIDLKKFHTLSFHAISKYWVEIKNTEEVFPFIKSNLFKKRDFFILGGGSNVLFTKTFQGTILKIGIKGIEILEEDDYSILIKAGAGEVWNDLVMYAVKNNWGGIENLSLIPGTVGATPIQNIGAYGVEVKDSIEWVETINLLDGTRKSWQNSDCQFGYRSSIFKKNKNFLITSVTYRLHKNPKTFSCQYGPLQKMFSPPMVSL